MYMGKSNIMTAGNACGSKYIRLNGNVGGGNIKQGLPTLVGKPANMVNYIRRKARPNNNINTNNNILDDKSQTSYIVCKVISVSRLVDTSSVDEIYRIQLNTFTNLKYKVGQHIGIIPLINGTKHNVRYYTIASSELGNINGIIELCVKRVVYEVNGVTNKGVTSNMLCDSKKGDNILVSGSFGDNLYIHYDTPRQNIIFVTNGVGISATYAFFKSCFVDYQTFSGNFYSFHGDETTDSVPYITEMSNTDRLYLFNALSETNHQYVQAIMEENLTTIITLLENGAYIYFCGSIAMLNGVIEMFTKNGVDVNNYKNQWHQEVY